MTPWTKEHLLKSAASFLYFRQQGEELDIWITPPVLTDKNPNDLANPLYTLEQANEIFRELEARELIKPAQKFVLDPDKLTNGLPTPISIGVFTLERTKTAEWVALINKKSFWGLSVMPTLYAIFGKRQTMWLAILALLATHFFGTLLKNSADRLFNHCFPPSQAKVQCVS
jgi:hypothetical protein